MHARGVRVCVANIEGVVKESLEPRMVAEMLLLEKRKERLIRCIQTFHPKWFNIHRMHRHRSHDCSAVVLIHHHNCFRRTPRYYRSSQWRSLRARRTHLHQSCCSQQWQRQQLPLSFASSEAAEPLNVNNASYT